VYTVIDRINAGGAQVTDGNGDVWRSDVSLYPGGGSITPPTFMPGMTYTFGNIPAAYTNVLFHERYGNQLRYNIPINGNARYEIQLLVLESWHQSATARSFNVDVQGTRVFSNVNPFVDSGFRTPYFLTVPVVVTDGSTTISVQLSNVAGSPQPPAVYGIVLLREQAVVAPPIVFDVIDRISTGGGQVTDGNGNVWRSDASMNPGGGTVRPRTYRSVNYNYVFAPEVAQYTAVLEYERYGDLTYSIPISGNGVYEVELLVVESWHNRADKREFNVDVQGTRVFSNVNMWVAVGFQKPYFLITRTEVTDGSRAITVQISRGNLPEIGAVYGITLRQGRVPPTTSSPTVAP